MAQLQSVKADVLGDALRVKDSPSQVLYQQFEEAGTDLAQVSALFCLGMRYAWQQCSRMRRRAFVCESRSSNIALSAFPTPQFTRGFSGADGQGRDRAQEGGDASGNRQGGGAAGERAVHCDCGAEQRAQCDGCLLGVTGACLCDPVC